MTNGAISMGMVDGIVMELQGFWIIGLVRVIVEACLLYTSRDPLRG